MAPIQFAFTRSPGKLEEFIKKLQSVGTPERVHTEYPKSIGFGSSHARGFPAVLRYAGLLDSSGSPTEAYKKGLRGGPAGRKLVGDSVAHAYKPLFDTYADASVHPDHDLVTFVKSNSDLDDEKAGLVVRTFKTLCKFGDFGPTSPSVNAAQDDGRREEESRDTQGQGRERDVARQGSGVVINVNIALSVDATNDSAVYDAFFSAMAKHLKGLMNGGS